MFNQIPLGGLLTVGNVVKVLEKRFPYVEVSSILGADSSYDSNRKVRRGRHGGRMLASFVVSLSSRLGTGGHGVRSMLTFNDCHDQKVETEAPHCSLNRLFAVSLVPVCVLCQEKLITCWQWFHVWQTRSSHLISQEG